MTSSFLFILHFAKSCDTRVNSHLRFENVGTSYRTEDVELYIHLKGTSGGTIIYNTTKHARRAGTRMRPREREDVFVATYDPGLKPEREAAGVKPQARSRRRDIRRARQRHI